MIKNFYGFENYSFSKVNNRIIIKYNNNTYYLEKICNLNEVVEQYNISNNINVFYKFILNINNDFVTEYNNSYYVLLEDNKKNNESIDFLSLFFLEKKMKLNWRILWILKSDYIEKYFETIRGRYNKIDESFDYYIGLLELAIFYLKEYDDYYGDAYIGHKRFNSYDYYNPLNIKVDLKERDFAEYLKFIFFNNTYKDVNLHELIFNYKDVYNYDIVVARLLYPNYYFDLFDEIVLLEDNQSILDSIISRNNEFELYLKEIISIFEKFYPIKKISFLRY